MDKRGLLKEGLDRINGGLGYLDNYLNEVEKTKAPDEIEIVVAIVKLCEPYHELCETVKKIYQKKVNKEV